MRKTIQRDAIVLFLFCGLYYVGQASYGPYLNAYFSEAGAGAFQLGILSAVGAVAGLVFQPIWALLSDRTGLRRTVVFLLAAGAGVAMLIFRHVVGFIGFLLCVILFHLFLDAIIPMSDSIIAGAAQRRSIDFSWIRLTGTLAYAAVVYLFGILIAGRWDRMFHVSVACFALLAVCAALLPREEAAQASAETQPARAQESKPDYETLAFLMLCTLGAYTINNLADGYVGVYVLQLGGSQAHIGTANMISSLSEVPILLLGRRLYRRYGVRLMYAALLASATRLLLFSTGSIPAIYAGQSLQGVCYMVAYYCQVMYLNEHAPNGRRARWFAMFGMLQTGFNVLLGSLLGGLVIARIGIARTYRLYALIGYASGALLFAVRMLRVVRIPAENSKR